MPRYCEDDAAVFEADEGFQMFSPKDERRQRRKDAELDDKVLCALHAAQRALRTAEVEWRVGRVSNCASWIDEATLMLVDYSTTVQPGARAIAPGFAS